MCVATAMPTASTFDRVRRGWARTLVVCLILVLWMTAAPAHAGQPAGSSPAGLAAFEKVTIRSDASRAAVIGYLRRPVGSSPAAVVIGLHDCDGMVDATGRLTAREADWSARWLAAGYAVLLVDSFGPRGLLEVCTIPQARRRLQPLDRARDAAAAVAWARTRPDLDGHRIALVGWSHGAMGALWAADTGDGRGSNLPVRAVVAFYPGCSGFLRARLEAAHLDDAADRGP